MEKTPFPVQGQSSAVSVDFFESRHHDQRRVVGYGQPIVLPGLQRVRRPRNIREVPTFEPCSTVIAGNLRSSLVRTTLGIQFAHRCGRFTAFRHRPSRICQNVGKPSIFKMFEITICRASRKNGETNADSQAEDESATCRRIRHGIRDRSTLRHRRFQDFPPTHRPNRECPI